jgi:hypothetical protein
MRRVSVFAAVRHDAESHYPLSYAPALVCLCEREVEDEEETG